MGSVLIIGHRGAAGYEPENTLRSFTKALEQGADMLECDVYALPSGELVVFHDRMLHRTTNGQGYLLHHSFRELRKLDAGKGERIPTLQEVLDLVDARVPLVVELKSVGSAKMVAPVIDDYVRNRGWQYDQFIVSSFYHHEVQSFKRDHAPHIVVAAPINAVPLGHADYALQLQADIVIADIDHVDEAFVHHAHRHNVKIFTYTIDTYEDTQLAYHLGIDGVFSNVPDISRQALLDAQEPAVHLKSLLRTPLK